MTLPRLPEVSRRSALLGMVGGAGAALLARPSPARATSGYATVILSPHQDDETLRLAAYITYMSDRGDGLALINATDGAATWVGRSLGLTPEETTAWRDQEQAQAWDWLTHGRGGGIIRLGFPDGQARREVIREAVAAQLSTMSGRPELYVAAYPHDRPTGVYAPSPTGGDLHPDHIACVQAARDLETEGVTVRYARHPSTSHITGTQAYDTTPEQFYRVEGAVAAYHTIGQRSVPEQFAHVLAVRGRSVIVR